MPALPLHLAASGFEAIFYLIVFVIWVAAQIGSARRKRAQQEEAVGTEPPPMPAPRRTGTPPVLREAPGPTNVDQEIRDLFERMTGVPAPPLETPPPARAPVPRPQPGHATRTAGAHRPQKTRPSAQRPQRAVEHPPPLRPSRAPEPVESPQMPAVVTEMQPMRISMKSLNVQLPKVRLPTFLTRSAVSPQSSGAGRLSRMAFLKDRGVLREVMLARAVLDPPKGLE